MKIERLGKAKDPKAKQPKMKAWRVTLSTGKSLVFLCQICETEDDVKAAMRERFVSERKEVTR